MSERDMTSELLAWIKLAAAADDAAITAVRLERAKAKLSHITPYRNVLADLRTAADAIQPAAKEQ